MASQQHQSPDGAERLIGSREPIGRWVLVGITTIAGLLQFILVDDTSALWCATTIAACAGVIGIATCVLRPADVTIWDVLATSICLGYGGGAFNTFVRYALDGTDAMTRAYAPTAALGEAMACVLLVSALLVALGRLDNFRPLTRLNIPAERFPEVLTATAVVALLGLLLMFTGAIGFQQDVSLNGEGGGRVSPIALTVVGALPPFAGIAAYCHAKAQGRQRLLFAILILLIMALLITQGRRIFAFSVVVCLMGYLSSNRRLNVHWVKLALIGLGVALAMQGASRMFFAMRMATWETSGPTSVVQLASRAIDIVLDGDRYDLKEQLGENVRDRSFVLDYLGELIDKLKTHEPSHGEVLKLSVALSVPSVIWSGKDRYVILGSEEVLVHPQLGLPIWDAANTVMTSGASDFGLVGIFLYPCAYALLYSLLVRYSRRRGGVIYLVFCLSLIFGLLNVEAALSSMFATVRQAALVSLGLFFALHTLDSIRKRWISNNPPVQSPESAEVVRETR